MWRRGGGEGNGPVSCDQHETQDDSSGVNPRGTGGAQRSEPDSTEEVGGEVQCDRV